MACFLCVCVCLLGKNNKRGFQVPNLYKAQYLETVIFKENGKLGFFCGNYPVVNKVDPISESVTMRAAVNTVKS